MPLAHRFPHVTSLCHLYFTLTTPFIIHYSTPIASLCQPLVPPPHLGTGGCTPARGHRHPRRIAEVYPLWGCWRSTWHLGCKDSRQTAPGKKCIIVQLECGISNCPPAKKCIEIKPVEAFKLLNSKYLQSHSVATSSKSVHLFISWMVYYLNNDLLLDAVSTVDPLNDMVRATVLDDSISYFDFPFKHADHKLSIKQELSTAIWYGWRETENNTSHTVLDPTETEWVVFRVKSNYRPLIGT